MTATNNKVTKIAAGFVNKENKRIHKYNAPKKITDLEKIERERIENLMEWVSYFRENPSRFAVEYLGITMLTTWQRFVLHMMFKSTDFNWIASRGLGKTFLVILYCVIRCILYPNTKIVYTSITLSAAVSYIKEKIGDLCNNYPNVASEIDKYDSKSDTQIFKNGSVIMLRPPSVNALGARANCIVIDENRKVDGFVIESVFQKFLTSPRRPRFMDFRDESGKLIYEDYPEEKNIEIYISSQSPTYEEGYTRYENAVKNMLKTKGTVALCTPYYLGVRDRVITKDRIIKDLKKEGADKSIFMLEYECVPYGDSDGKFFTNEMFVKNRTILDIWHPMSALEYIENKGDVSKNPFYMPKLNKEKRILAVDTALTNRSGSANTIVHCIRLIPVETKKTRTTEDGVTQTYTDRYYEKHVVYTKNIRKDMTPSVQAIIIKRIFTQFQADLIAIDTQGTSLAVVYEMIKPHYDSEYNIDFPAFDSVNDEYTSSMCKEPRENRLKVMYNVNIAGSTAHEKQHRYNVYTKNELSARHIRFPSTSPKGETHLREKYNYDLQSANTQGDWISVYKECDLLIMEAVNLERKSGSSDTKILLEVSKKSVKKNRDRIIALQYGLLLAQELEIEDFKYQTVFDHTKYGSNNRGIANKNSRRNPFGSKRNQIKGFGWNR